MTEIFTNRVWIVRLIFSKQTLETTHRWLTVYRWFRALFWQEKVIAIVILLRVLASVVVAGSSYQM